MVNPGSEVMRKLGKSKFVERIGGEFIYLTVYDAVNGISFMLHSHKCKSVESGDVNINNNTV